MKKISYFFSLVLVALSLTGCKEGTDFDIDYTPLAPIGGQYVVAIYAEEDASSISDKEFWATHECTDANLYTFSYAFLSNTTDYATDKAWVRVGSYSASNGFNINAKVNIDMNSCEFDGQNVQNLAGNKTPETSTSTCSVSGFAKHNGITLTGINPAFEDPENPDEHTYFSGTTTDYIEFVYSNTAASGMRFKAVGYKYTGWPEDDY